MAMLDTWQCLDMLLRRSSSRVRGCGVVAALSGGSTNDTRELSQKVLGANNTGSNSSCEASP